MTNPWNLPPRQVEVMQLLTTGAAGCNKTVARFMGISDRTVEAHVLRAMAKMKAPNRVQAALEWDRWARGQE